MGRFSALLRGGVGAGGGKEPGGTAVDTPREARASGGGSTSLSISAHICRMGTGRAPSVLKVMAKRRQRVSGCLGVCYTEFQIRPFIFLLLIFIPLMLLTKIHVWYLGKENYLSRFQNSPFC